MKNTKILKIKLKKTKGYSINITFDEFQKIYFKEYGKTDIKKSTAYNYKTTVKNHINPKFKNIKVKDITTQQINDFLLNLKLKNSSKKKTKIVFSSIMEYAKKLKIIYVKNLSVKDLFRRTNITDTL